MKKRILSLILALSMVLSVLPLGAFAEGSNQDLVMQGGFPVGSNNGTANCDGDGWWYRNGILYLNAETYDFSYINPQTKAGGSTKQPVLCEIEIQLYATITGGTFNATVYNGKRNSPGGTISNGIFNGEVKNSDTIENGTFAGSVTNEGTIGGGTFEGTVTNRGDINGGAFQSTGSVTNSDTIRGGEFEGTVTNSGNINGGAFQSKGSVTNEGAISGGKFEGTVTNSGTITGYGTFAGKVTNLGNIESNGIFNGPVTNIGNGTIVGGTFKNSVTSTGNGAAIGGGEFKGTVTNNDGATILGGTFQSTGSVTNGNGAAIGGGTFEGTVINSGSGQIVGGTFNGNAGRHNITWDAAYPNAKITEVNGVSADWTPHVVVIQMPTSTAKEVTITANTEIYSLNGQPIGTGDYKSSYPDENDKTTVTFTMPSGNVVLGTGELVMKDGLPDCPNGTKGNGWEYRSDTLILTSGTYDFSSTHPQNTSAGTKPAPAVQCPISIAHAKITDGTFSTTVYNGAGGTISDGTFHGEVGNSGKISGGTFSATVNIYGGGTIFDGTFNGKVGSSGTISGGTFSATVENNTNGTISGGTFAAGLSWNDGSVTGGVFNGDAKISQVDGLHSIKWDDAYPNAKITKVNDVPADWKPYVVVTQWTTATAKEVTITADTEIFSLNHESISADKYGVDKKTVKFTMPDDKDVVLNGAITCTELVMKGGYPEASNGGTIPCKGTGWEYSNGTLVLENVAHFDFSSTEPVKCAIQSGAHITGGTFEGTVTNKTGGGAISDGIFKGSVENSSVINGGTFRGQVDNSGKINGGIFAAGLSKNTGNVTGGIFNGNTELTDAHRITVTDGSVSKVNGEGPLNADGTPVTAWDPYVVVTEWTPATAKEVTIKANTEIFSLNGKSIVASNCDSEYPDTNDKTTVKFTMPDDKDVVLNGAITCTDLVMEKGWPEASNEGTISCEGTGWSYDHITKTLTLTDGTFDLSSTEPVKCAIQSSATITGGTFEKKVTNNAGGTISGGTFQDTCSVTNSGTIKKGTFKDVCSVTNEGANATIENGTFKNMCRVTNNSTIENGTFKDMCSVENNGTINNGTFTYKVENNGIITGGVFNRNANLTGVTGGYNITVASNAKIEKVNGVSADWAPYVVTSNAMPTTKEVTITADTEIFSLNGQPISTGNCNSSYGSDKTTVTFTMPDDKDVVLNEEINYGDLVMENGYPVGSNGGKDPCKGDGWQYIKNDPTNGDMLLLTGNSQTGGLYDFSTIGDGSPVECNVFVGKPTAITGGEFNVKVFNNSGILGGTFNGPVDNRAPGIIKDGTFNGAVENNGMIENGTFKNMCRVINNRTIENGTFEGTVENNTNGTISGGTFAGSVSNNGGTVNGGIFNGNTGLDEVTDLHSITVASGAKIEKVNGVPAEWAPYVVTSNATTKEVTITADTEIFSLNGQPIAESSYGVDKKTVTFTMPDDDVVLNGELITKPEPEPEPKPEPEPEPKPEPKPEPETKPTTYTVTVIGGTIDGKTSVSAKEKDTLTVVLDQSDIPDGMTFDMWSISSSKLSGDINVDYRAEAMTFPMPAEDVTIRAQYRSAEIIEDAAPSPLATAATVALGGAAAGIVVWQGVSLGVDLYLTSALPQGVPVPTDRRALALLLWETAGKPEVALPTLYGDVPAEEIELQKATRWAVQNGLMDAADKKDASFFDPDHYVTKMDVFGAWLRLKKLLGTT